MTDRISIAILGSRGYPSTYGGFETFVRRLAPWLVARGHTVTVYGRSTARRTEYLVDGVRVVETMGLSSKSLSTATHGLTAAFDAVRSRPDVVLALNVANGPALPLIRAPQVPVVMNVDGLEWQRDKWGAFAKVSFRIGARLSARFAQVLVADSEEIARVWNREFGVTPTFIPYGADVAGASGEEMVTSLGLTPGSYALAVARLAPENHVELFVDAMERLDWKVPAVVVGSANYSNPLEERLAELTSAGKLKWLGHVSDQTLLSQLWANCGVYFHGHSVGGTNPALLQALGHGAPTVALDTPFNREVLGITDQLVAPHGRAVAEKVSATISNHQRQALLRTRGRRIVSDRYLWDDVLLRYESVLVATARAAL